MFVYLTEQNYGNDLKYTMALVAYFFLCFLNLDQYQIKKNNDTKFTNVQSNKKYLIKGWREQMKRENSEVQELRK